MPDYRDMYMKLFDGMEKAIEILIAAQLECEDIYIDHKEPEIKVLPLFQNSNNADEE